MIRKIAPKILLLVSGILLLVSFVFPNGATFAKKPVPPVVPTPVVTPSDETISKILLTATSEDRQRIHDVYSAAAVVLQRDTTNAQRLTTTEQWSSAHAHILQLAIDTPGKYPGLDSAIEAVFRAAVGTDDVASITPEISKKLIHACEVVAASARKS